MEGWGFKVRRQEAVLVVPEKPTKREFKELSDIDDQQATRVQVKVIMSFKGNLSSKEDPAKVIKMALAKTLVYYYPFAGRIKEIGRSRKLIVDCNSKGVLFIEADADVSLNEIQTQLLPPCPFLEHLLYDHPRSSGIIDCPLLLFQVTRLRCGGHILAIRFNHTMCDLQGCMQFLKAVAEIARGALKPCITPIWRRKLLRARFPPRVTCTHHEYNKVGEKDYELVNKDGSYMVLGCSFFGPREVQAIRNNLPSHLQHSCSTFELLCACIWRCRTIGLQPNPEEIVQFSMFVNVGESNAIILPPGYYGNSFVAPTVSAKAKDLMSENSLAYALQRVKESRTKVNEEYVRSMMDFIVTHGRPKYKEHMSWMASNATYKGIENVDFGWGSPLCFTIPRANSTASTFTRFKNSEGEHMMGVLLCLPEAAFLRYQKELGRIIGVSPQPSFVKSKL